jgi:hypothetical protein
LPIAAQIQRRQGQVDGAIIPGPKTSRAIGGEDRSARRGKAAARLNEGEGLREVTSIRLRTRFNRRRVSRTSQSPAWLSRNASARSTAPDRHRAEHDVPSQLVEAQMDCIVELARQA